MSPPTASNCKKKWDLSKKDIMWVEGEFHCVLLEHSFHLYAVTSVVYLLLLYTKVLPITSIYASCQSYVCWLNFLFGGHELYHHHHDHHDQDHHHHHEELYNCCARHSNHVAARGKPSGISSLLLPCCSWVSVSPCHAMIKHLIIVPERDSWWPGRPCSRWLKQDAERAHLHSDEDSKKAELEVGWRYKLSKPTLGFLPVRQHHLPKQHQPPTGDQVFKGDKGDISHSNHRRAVLHVN